MAESLGRRVLAPPPAWALQTRALRRGAGGRRDAAGHLPEPPWPAQAMRGCNWAGKHCRRRPHCWSPPCCLVPRSAWASACGSAAARAVFAGGSRWVPVRRGGLGSHRQTPALHLECDCVPQKNRVGHSQEGDGVSGLKVLAWGPQKDRRPKPFWASVPSHVVRSSDLIPPDVPSSA